MGLIVAVVVAVALSAVTLASGAHAPAASARITPASGNTQQWAFGGSASEAYSCSNTGCPGSPNITSISLSYYVGWVAIYTVTNVSASQVEVEAQGAINATLSLSISGCITESSSGPCSSISLSANLAGRDTATGFTNITNTGTVNVVNGTTPGPTTAWAIMNANSNASFNFTGAYSESVPANGTTETGTINFDLGGNAASSVNFPTPLGLVPLNPAPGESWNATEPFTATGSYTSGYSLSENVDGHSYSSGDWQHLGVSPSGDLGIFGSDLGTATLYDNYTSPATTVTAQIIALQFDTGGFYCSDGWLMLPSGLYLGAEGALGGSGLLAELTGASSAATPVVGSGESAYYQSGTGFVGVDEQQNTTALGGSGGPQFNLKAGPEPVSVAQSQYNAITQSSASSSSSFPWTLAVIGVVVVIVVVVAVLVVGRSRRRSPPTAMTPLDAAPMAAGPAGASGPSNMAPVGPAMPQAPQPAVPMGSIASAAPICPNCGQPATYVEQYSRYYCYTDKAYL